MNIKPFTYGMDVTCCYDNGSVLTKDVVALSPNDIIAKF